MKSSNDAMVIRTRDLPAGSAVPQPTAPPCSSLKLGDDIFPETSVITPMPRNVPEERRLVWSRRSQSVAKSGSLLLP